MSFVGSSTWNGHRVQRDKGVSDAHPHKTQRLELASVPWTRPEASHPARTL